MKGRVTGKLNVATQVVLMAAILAVVNFLAARHFVRADFTAEKEYTLAPASRRVLGGLKDIVTVNVYFSRTLPPYLANLQTKVKDLLEEYRAYGGKNIQVSFISPEDDPASQQKMRMLGIPQVRLNVLDKDQFQMTQVYMGLAVLYGKKKEVLPVIQESDDLEYNLTGAILKVVREETVKVALAYDEDEEMMLAPQAPPYSLLEQELKRQYDYVPYRFMDGRPIPGDVTTLVVAGMSDPTDAELYRLDQFVARGGKLLLLVDAIQLPQESLMGRAAPLKLDRLLKTWGLEVKPQAVVDPRSNAPASFSSGFLHFRIPYPYWPDVPPGGFDQEHPVVGKLESLVLPWTSPVDAAGEKPPGLEYKVLARSSPSAWAADEPFDFTPSERPPLPPGETKPQPMVILASGVFNSAFAEGALPEGLGDEEKKELRRQSPKTAVIVVGTSRLARDNFLEQFPGNGIFLMNAIDWLSQGQDLIGIRSRGATERPLPDLSVQAKSGIRYFNIFAVSGLMLLIGGIRFYVRRHGAARGR